MTEENAMPLPSDRSFGFTFAAVFAVVGGWMAWKSNPHFAVAFGLAALILLASLAFPRILHPLNVAWMRLAVIMNHIVSPIVMGVIYFGVLTPVATAMRLRGRDVLHRQFTRGLASYWITRDPPGPEGSSFTRQF